MRGMTKADYAKAIGVNQKTIRLWESGKNFPKEENLKKMKIKP